MKNLIFTLALLISFSSFGQLFSDEDLDKIINERTWCITNITVNGENDRPEGKWMYISGMNLVFGENDHINGVNDILNKVYSGDGIKMTFIGRNESPVTLSLKIPQSKEQSLLNEGELPQEDELIGEWNDDKDYLEFRLSCTSLIGRIRSLPTKNWNGNK